MKHIAKSVTLLAASIAAAPAFSEAQATPDNSSTTVGVPVVIDVLANDTGAGSLWVENYSTTTSYGGSVTLNDDQTLTYVPAEGFTGTDTFTYDAVDSTGYGGSALVTVLIEGAAPTPTPTPTPEVTPTPVPEVTPTPVVPTDTPLAGIDLTAYAAKGNNLATAKALMAACGSNQAGEQLAASCQALLGIDAENGAEINDIISDISADEFLTQRRILSELSRGKTGRMYDSMGLLRGGQNAFSVAYDGMTQRVGGGAGDGFSSPWSFVSSVYVQNAEYQKTQNEAAYESQASGAMVGLSYRLNRSLMLGAAVDWSQYSVEYGGNAGNIDADQLGVVAFLSWYVNSLSVDAQLGYSFSDASLQRNVTFPMQNTASSDNSSGQLDASLQTQWNLHAGAWGFNPYLRLDYVSIGIDAFSETGAYEWRVDVGDQSVEQLNTALGLSGDYTMAFSWGVLIPELKFSLIQKTALDDGVIDLRFAASSNEDFYALDADSDEDLFYEWQLNTVFVMKNGLSTFVSGRTIAGHETMDSYDVSAGINIEF